MKSSKSIKIGYWITTGMVGAMMAFAGFAYLSSQELIIAFREHLHIPDFLRIELGIAKLLGAVILLIPFRHVIKEWTYAGFVITFISAIIAHISVGDPASDTFKPLFFLAVLITSYFFYKKLFNAKA